MKAMVLLLLALAATGCGSRDTQETEPLSFHELADTSGLGAGEPLLTRVESDRMENGALRVRGTWDVPDGTRLQVSVYDSSRNEMLGRWQMTVTNRRFESPPMLGKQGPLPEGRLRIEYRADFNEAWQPAEVLEATDDGRRLRGPGMTRDAQGGGVFYLVEERRL